MERLYLTRHGETELNRAGRLQGRMDSSLTDRGCQQAHRVAEKLSSVISDTPIILWVSPLGRAQQTACIISDYLAVAETRTDPRLAEISLGDWEGMTMEDIEFTHPGQLDGTGRFDWAYRAPNGETETAFRARLEDWLDDIANTNIANTNDVNVAVSHGWSGMGLRSIYSGAPFEQVSAKGDSHEAVFEFSAGAVREF